MKASAPDLPQQRPTDAPRRSASVKFAGREYPLLLEREGWRLRSRSKSHPADFRTGSTNLADAKRLAKEWLERRANDPIRSRKGGGTLEALAKIYEKAPKRTQAHVAKDNISRLRSIVRVVFGKELAEVTCRQIGAEFWAEYQRRSHESRGLAYDLATRYRENIAINAAVRAARCLFLPALRPYYREAGLDVRADADQAVILPEPYVPPAGVDDQEIVRQWRALKHGALWLVIGLARFAGLRRDEIEAIRGDWIRKTKKGATVIELRDRPEHGWWTKTGKPYTAQVIDPDLSTYLLAAAEFDPEGHVVKDVGDDRERWFERDPQAWLRALGVKARQPLHRLRGLYADAIRELTEEAVEIRLAGIKAAQKNLGHTSSETTERSYLTPDALR